MNFIKSILHLIRYAILTTFLLTLVIFMVSNRGIATIKLYPLPFEIETRIFIVMLAFFLLGLIFGILLCSKNIMQRIFENFKSRRKIKKLEQQIKN